MSKWDTIYINELSSFSISPESREIILDNNVKEKLKLNYFLIFLNILIVVFYSFILSIILTFSRNLFLRHFSIIFTILFVYFLAYFPGIYTSDPLDQVNQAITLNINDWHPPFHTLTFLIVLRIFNHIGFYVLIQIIISSVLFAWITSKFRINEIFIILFFLFPLTSLFLITAWKDIPYTLSLIWFSFFVYFSYKENKFNLLMFILSLSFIMLFRYNGIILVPFLLGFMVLLFKDKIRKIGIIFLSLILIYLVSYVFFYKILRVSKSTFQYQKDFLIISHYVVNNYPFDENDKKIIEEIMPIDKIKERYNCLSVNPLFWGHSYFNFEKYRKYRHEIRKILFKLVFTDFSRFFESILCSSSYIYHLNQFAYFNSYHSDEYVEWDILKAKLFKNPKLPQIQKIIEKITDNFKHDYFYFYITIKRLEIFSRKLLYFTFDNINLF